MWQNTGLPLKVHPQWGFLGHGGYLLPKVLVLSAAFAFVWAIFACVHWLIHCSQEGADRRRVSLAGGLACQAGFGLLRIGAFSIFAVLYCIVAGNVVVLNLTFFSLLILGFLVARGIAVGLYGFLSSRRKRSQE